MKHTSNHSSLLGRARKLVSGLLTGLATTGLLATSFSAHAQLSLTSSAPVTETFDGLGTAVGSVPTGFVLAAGATGISYTNPANTTLTTRIGGTSGTNAMNSSSAGGAYNFGNGVTATATDRALGFLSSSSFSAPRHLLLAIRNNTGTTITDLAVAYDVEKYRTGINPYEWQFFTSPDGTTWTQPANMVVAYGADGANAVVNPAATTSKTFTLSGLALEPGATTYLRWSYVGTLGSTNAQALGLDNLKLTPTLLGGTPAATIATGSVPTTPFCVTNTAGSSAFAVAYTSSGSYTGSYKVQLSDASGVFPTSTTVGIIGTGSSSPISASIPAGTPSGTRYRVRVLNDAPATYGADNGADLTVSLTPDSNPVTVSPASAQTVPTDGIGATLAASAAATSTYSWQFSTSPTGTYTSIGGATSASYLVKGSSFPGAGTYYLVAQATITTSCGTLTTQSEPIAVTVSAPVVPPGVQVSATGLPNFGNTVVGAATQQKTFTVSGTSLTGPITITPPAGFEIRTGNSPFACCAIVLSPVGGSVPSTTIEVRFTPTDAQAAQASIPVATTGLATQSVAVSGTGIAAVYPATLSTTPVSDLTPTSATTGGEVATDGGSAVTARGVLWATTANPVLGASQTTNGAGIGTFSSPLTGLLPGTTYFVRAYATNATGTTYGEEFSFTTVTVPLAAEPTASGTLSASLVTSSSAQLNLSGGDGTKYLVVGHLGSAVDADPVDATTYTADLAFGTGSVLGKGNFVVYNGTGNNITVTGLRPNTSYYFSVFAFNDNNTPYAENYLTTSPGTVELTTPALAPTLLLEENFEYAAGSLLTANNWTAHSGAGNRPVAVTSTGLSFAGYNLQSGNAAAVAANGEDVNRAFAPVFARTPVYASFLVNASNASTTGDYFFHLGPQTIGTTFRARVFARKTATGKVQFGISGSGTAVYAPEEYALNTTHLLVVKYTYDEAGNTSTLFIDPSTTATEPSTAAASVTETGTIDNIGAVALRQGTNFPTLVVDGIRVGTTYRVARTGLTCTDPVLTVPTLATAQTTAEQCGASVVFAATASAAGTPAPAITYSIEKEGVTTAITSPYLFPVGTTTVTATATNACGTDTKTFTVTVEDKQAPVALTQPLTVALSQGTATITADQVNNSSSDACGIASLSLDRTSFSCENIGENTVTLTVTDVHGNTSTATATITVTGEIPKPAIAVTPGSRVYTGGIATNLYLGYGPQSATLTASGGVSYSWSPATGLSSATSAAPVFTASTPGVFTFTVTVTSASGCTATKSVTLTVRDVRCGNKNDKVSVCHKGKPSCISAGDVADHLSHGDQLGDCSTDGLTATSSASSQLSGQATLAAVFEAYPNPFTDRTVVHFRAATTGQAQLQLYNSLGQLVKTYYTGIAQSGQNYEYTVDGSTLPAGIYIGRLVLDGKMQNLRLVLSK
ncbi:Por secretion system C-terminal sorting domain-containing protein [Hymenobacter gelipurpurascens]|uniref:Por secretion system C-terminal sorting domain-containing protein n=1 Tax=Hymenobacter gelipurpurascens TaxID=89968 RepID=A0A212TQM1_9BACT|nr:T9SS type A sorting domain-containing protein [Hymenobacter gelipurpurascens]SNC68319.1 Por secretion system C-terminal sorting domain-containing protein [Hymenobacter gelipurpurascens]